MAYSKSPVTLIRRRQYVEPLFRGERTRWVAPFPGNVEAETWAYKIRECLHVALKHPRRFPDLARFAKLYRVVVLNDTTVQAFVEGSEDSGETPAGIVVATVSEPVTLPGTTRYDVVNAFREGILGVGPWTFPAVNLGMVERGKLEAWASKCEPPLAVQETHRGLTISRRDQ